MIFLSLVKLLIFLTCQTGVCRTVAAMPIEPALASQTITSAALPQCSQISATTAELRMENLDTAELLVETAIQTQLNFGQTACIKAFFDTTAKPSGDANASRRMTEAIHYSQEYDTLYSSGLNGSMALPVSNTSRSELKVTSKDAPRSLMYAFHYAGLEQQYPIKQRYEFAIPRIDSNCTCDCPGGDVVCPVKYKYQNCSRGDVCVTTYHPHQNAKGCLNPGTESELCCEVFLKPQSQRRFHALYLGQPVTFVRLRLFAYLLHTADNAKSSKDRSSDQLTVIKQQEFLIPATQTQTIQSQEGLKASVQLESSQFRLAEGMHYFAPLLSVTDQLHSPLFLGVPLNEFQEWDLGKLGWFRFEKGRWIVKNANLKFQLAQHTQVEDCKAQSYTDVYDAEFYNMEADRLLDSFSAKVTDYYAWVSEATYVPSQEDIDRHVSVSSNNGPSIKLNIELKDRPQITFSFHVSKLTDFSGAISLDRYSNRFLNISFIGARGTLIGAVYRSSNRLILDTVLSTDVDEQSPATAAQVLLLPSVVNGSRWVCFYPSTKPEEEKCKQFEYSSEPLSWFIVPVQPWAVRQGECDGCNEFSTTDFLRYLNPKQWFNGISSTSEALAVGVEVVFYAVAIIIAIACCKKCVCPVIQWSFKGKRTKRGFDDA